MPAKVGQRSTGCGIQSKVDRNLLICFKKLKILPKNFLQAFNNHYKIQLYEKFFPQPHFGLGRGHFANCVRNTLSPPYCKCLIFGVHAASSNWNILLIFGFLESSYMIFIIRFQIQSYQVTFTSGLISDLEAASTFFLF